MRRSVPEAAFDGSWQTQPLLDEVPPRLNSRFQAFHHMIFPQASSPVQLILDLL